MTRLTTSRATRYTVQGLLALGAVGLGIWGVILNIGGDAQAQTAEREEPRQIDPVVYAMVQTICRTSALTDDDLAALDLSEEQTTAALTALVDWCEANASRHEQAHQQVIIAQRTLAQLERDARNGNGPPNPDDGITGARQALDTARSALTAIRKEGAEHAVGAGAPNQVAKWQKAYALVEVLPADLRHVSTMDPQRLKSLYEDMARRGIPMDEALSHAEQQERQAIRRRVASNRAMVQAAVATAAPAPQILTVASSASE